MTRALDAKPCNHAVILHGIMTTWWQYGSRVSRGRSQGAAAILDAPIGGTAGDRRTPAARATNPRVPRGASAENGRRDRCLAARSFHGGRSRWFTVALSDDGPCGLAFGQGPAAPPWPEPPAARLHAVAARCRRRPLRLSARHGTLLRRSRTPHRCDTGRHGCSADHKRSHHRVF